MEKRLTMFLACLFLSLGMALAQTQFSGTVVSAEDGQPIIGASIKVVGTKTGTVTNIDGDFSLSAAAGAKLEISYIGMKSKTVTAKANMKIALEADNHSLDEVMVVAYGTQKRSQITGSAAEVKSSDISKHIASTATSALGGKVAGVQLLSSSGEPGTAPKIRIRGIGSYSASSAPLYILDGAPYDGDISSINPTDIESMTVLKDAAASAIYGSRGANGVVILTTKKARGAHDAKITVDAKWGSNHRELPRYDLITDPGQYYETFYRAMFNSQYYHGKSEEESYAYANNNLFDSKNGGLGYNVYTVPEGETLIGKDFKLNPNAKLGYSDGKYYYTPDNYYDMINNSSFRQEYNVNINGASDRLSYYASLGYLKDGGIVANSDMQRYTARTNVEYQAKKWLKFASNMSFARTDANSPSFSDKTYGSSSNMFYIANMLAPIYPLYVRDATGAIMTNALGSPVYDANQTNFTRPAIMGNAIRDNMYDRSNSTIDQFTGNWVATVTPVDGLDLVANLTAWSYNKYDKYLYSRFGSGSSVDGQTEAELDRKLSLNQIYTANYNKEFGKHSISALLGYEHYMLKKQDLTGKNDHLYDPFIGELDNALGHKKERAESSSDELYRDGFFFRGDYNYDDTYFGEVSVRRDGSSIFAPGHRWGTFWSASAGWMISKEKWFKASWVDLLKLKLSYGEQGNDYFLDALGNLEFHPWTDKYTASYNEDSGEYSLIQSYVGNDNLTWEKSGELNFGVDFAFFHNRLSGSLEVFSKKTRDLLYDKTLPLSSGYSVATYPANIGAMTNKGIEFSVNGDIVRNQNVTWSVNFNATHVKTKMTELDPSISAEGLKGSSSILRVGGSRYEAYMYKSAGVNHENGLPLYYMDEKDKDGNVTVTTTTDLTKATKYDLGDVLPDVYGGFGTTLNLKQGIDFSIQFSYQLGGRIYDGVYQQYMHGGESSGIAMHKDLLNAWSAENPTSNIPRLSTVDADNQSIGAQTAVDTYLTSSNYLNLNNVTLGYTLPKALVNRLAMSNLRIYVAGENLFLLSARKGFDPRTSLGVGTFTSGAALISGGGYAAMRSITAGIQLTF